MARLPIIKRLQQGGTATEDLPAQTGGAGAFPGTTNVDEEGTTFVKPLSGVTPDQKVGLTTGEKLTPQQMAMQTGEEIGDISVATQTAAPTVTTGQASTTGLNVATPTATDAVDFKQSADTYSAYVDENSPTATAAQGNLSAQSIIGDPSTMAYTNAIQGTVSEGSQATAAQGTVSNLSTVKGQLESLFTAIKEGEELPAWAAPAVRKVNAIMQQRGLGASSMAAAAITQAVYESAIPIAAQDAKTYATVDLQNLNNQQQTALQNATVYAAMDKQNLDARLQSAVNNARSFLSIDTANLTNQQQSNTITHQLAMQKLFNDQAAENAERQFNAKSNNQVMEFFSELGTQVENANMTREAAMRQFNADQANATGRFVAQMEDSRQKFNANMSVQIDQSNADWRRNINTANTSLINETNRVNAQNLLGLSTHAQNQLWQRYRDEASWVLQKAESAAGRAHAYAMTSQQNEFSRDTYEQEFKDNTYAEMGKTVLYKVFGLI
mgnify:FL=1|tara:strand:+ start:605 stop:2095 length:1491 start_codon:yes stop_codon:yes gene_type:complete